MCYEKIYIVNALDFNVNYNEWPQEAEISFFKINIEIIIFFSFIFIF